MEETLDTVEQQDPPKKLSVKDFAAKIKAKYPDYSTIGDDELVQKIVTKYPDYKEQIDFTQKKSLSQNGVPVSTNGLSKPSDVFGFDKFSEFNKPEATQKIPEWNGSSIEHPANPKYPVRRKYNGKEVGFKNEQEADAYEQNNGVVHDGGTPNNLQQAANKDRQVHGNRLGYIMNSLGEGVGSLVSGANDFAMQGMINILPKAVVGGDKNEAIKQFREHVSPQVKEGISKVLEDPISPELKDKYDKEFVTSAIGGLAQTIPAILAPKGTKAMAFFSQMYDGGLQMINSTEEGKSLPENEKTIFGAAVGGANAAIMAAGIDKILGKQTSKVATGLAIRTLQGLMKKSSEPITAAAFEAALNTAASGLKQQVLKVGGNVASNTVIGGLMGASMEGVNEVAKKITNKLKDKDVFEPESWQQVLKNVGHSAASTALGGVLLGAVHLPFSETRNYISEKVAKAKTAEDITALKDEVLQNHNAQNLSPEEAQGVSDLIDNYARVNSKVPIDIPNRKETVEKIIEREDVQKAVADKTEELKNVDESFKPEVQKEVEALNSRVKEINDDIVNPKPEPEHITVNDMIGKDGSYKGQKGSFYQDGQTVIFSVNGKNKEYELGNVDEIKDTPIKDFGIEHEQSIVNVNDAGNIEVRGNEYVNNYSDPLQAVNRDKEGNIVSVNLETSDGKKRTFKGNVAEDIAYQIHLKKINKDNETRARFENFINDEPSIEKEINDAGFSEITSQNSTENNAEISRETIIPETPQSKTPITETPETKQENKNKSLDLQNGDITSKEQAIKGAVEPGSDQAGADTSGEKIKVLKKRAKPTIKSPLYKKALESPSQEPLAAALKYFIQGGKIHTEALTKLFGRKGKAKNIQGELNAKISLRGKDAPRTIERLGEDLWNEAPEHIQEKFDSQDFSNAVEEILLNHNSRTSMASELVKHGELSEPEKEMSDWYEQTYGKSEVDEEHLNHAIDALEGLSDKEIQHILDTEKEALSNEEFINNIAAKYEEPATEKPKEGKADAEAKIKSAQSAYDNATRELKTATDKLAKEQAKQSDMFAGGQQKGMFAPDAADAKSILDPLKQKVKETKAALDKANLDLENEVANTQPELPGLNKAEINVANNKLTKEQAKEIADSENLTLENIDANKHLFNGFPFTPEDYQQVKTFLKEQNKLDAVKNSDGTITVKSKSGLTLIFQDDKQVERYSNKNGITLNFIDSLDTPKEKVINNESENTEPSSLKEVLDNHENSDNSTFDDLVNSVEAFLENNPNEKLDKAVNDYRKEQEYDESLKGRGDMDKAEENFQKVLNKEIENETGRTTAPETGKQQNTGNDENKGLSDKSPEVPQAENTDTKGGSSTGEIQPEGKTGETTPAGDAPEMGKMKKAGDVLRKFADKVESGKINKLGGFKSSTGFDAVWDASLSVVAKSLRTGATLADAIEAGLAHIRSTDWYKNLTDKKDFEEKYSAHLESEYKAEEPLTVTSIKNAQVDKERAARGLPKAIQPARKEFGVTWDRAMARIDKNPVAGQDLVDELKSKARPLTDEDNAVLLHHQIMVQNDYATTNEAINNANGDQRIIKENTLRLARISDDLLDIYNVGKAAGTENARGLVTRKMMAKEDFTLAAMETQKRAANGGNELNEKQKKEITDLNKKIQETTKAYEEALKISEEKRQAAEERLSELQAKKGFEKVKDDTAKVVRREKRAVTKEAIHKEREAIKSNLKNKWKQFSRGQLNAGIPLPVEMIPDILNLAKNYIKEGIVTLDGVVDKVHEDLSEFIDGIDKRSVRDAISGYGKTKKPTADEIEKQLSEIKQQGRLVSGIEDAKMGEPPLRSGFQRPKPSDEVRGMMRELNKAIKDNNIEVRNPEQQLKTSLDGAKTRLRNQIQDLTDAIDKNEKITRDKAGITYDEEATKLKAERDQKRKEYDEIFGTDKELTDEQRIQMATKAIEKNIEKLQEKIDNKDFSKPERTPITSPELDKLRKKKAELVDTYNSLMDAEGELTKRKLDAYKKHLAKTEAIFKERLRTGDFEKKVRTPLQLDDAAFRAKANMERARNEFRTGLEQDRLKNRTGFQKFLDNFVMLEREIKLTSPITVLKLTMAASHRITSAIPEEIVGGFFSKILPKIAAKSPTEAGFNVKAEAKVWAKGFIKGIEDSWKTMALKTKGGLGFKYGGKSDIETVYGKQGALPAEVSHFFGHLHGALKAPVKRMAFERSANKMAAWYIKNNIDPNNPVIAEKIGLYAYKNAQRSIFMNDNAVATAFSVAMRGLENNKVNPQGGQVIAAVSKFFLPFVRIPTNIVSETATYAFGLPAQTIKSTARSIARVLGKNVAELTPEQADAVFRNFKKGSLGAGLLLLGYFNSSNIGGYYQDHEKRKPEDVKAGGVRLGGWDVPKWAVHNPLLECLQIGSTAARVFDHYTGANAKAKAANDQTAEDIANGGTGSKIKPIVGNIPLKAAGASLLGLTEELPMVDQPIRIYKGLWGSDWEQSRFWGELLKSSTEPALLQKAAEWFDTHKGGFDPFGEPRKLDPKDAADYFKSGMPGLRNEVPEKKVKATSG